METDSPWPFKNDLQRTTGARETEIHPDLVEMYSVFRDAFQPKADVVYHPCCATDSSPSAAFPDSRVIFVDLDEQSIGGMKAIGLEAYTADATTFDPGPVDVLILLNPAMDYEEPASHLIAGGYALVNNYHGTANDFYRDPDFELLAIIDNRTPDGKPAVDRDHPDQYWELVETDEEFRSSPAYEAIAFLVEKRTGISNLDLHQYKQAINEALDESPSPLKMDGYLIFPGGGMMPAFLPTKKGASDDFFVFRRKEVSSS